MKPPDPTSLGTTRRDFLKKTSLTVVALAAIDRLPLSAENKLSLSPAQTTMDITLKINGVAHAVTIEPRVTLLDALRERIGLTGTKKGCDRGECGACTVHLDGRRTLSCMTLAVMAADREITTIEGLGQQDQLHPLQAAFIEHDAFQCGFCTSGQIMSGVGCIREGYTSSANEVAEFMSGNLCRCAAYPQIRAAILDAAAKGGV